MKNVATTTSNKNRTDTKPNTIWLISLNNASPISLNNSTIPILIVLFAIRMVANSFFGFESSSIRTTPFLVRSSSILFKSVGDNPKSATSAPEINAEHNNSVIKHSHLEAKTASKAKNSRVLRGSGSN